MVDKALKFILLLSPLVYMSGVPLKTFSIFFFHISVIVLFAASMNDTIKRNFLGAKVISILLAICLLNIVLHRFNIIVMNRCVNIFLAIVVLNIIIRYCEKPKDCYKYIVIAGIINVVVFLFQRIGFNPILNDIGKNVASGNSACNGGLMGNLPRLGIYLTLILAFLPIWFFIVCLIIGIVTKELAIIGMAVIILFIRKKNICWRITLGLIVLVGLVIGRYEIIEALSFRFGALKDLSVGFFSKPMAGYGLGVYPYLPNNILITYDTSTYASFLEFVTGIGVLGAVWLGWVLNFYRKKITGSIASLGVLSIILLSCIEYPLEIYRLWPTIIAVIGFFIIETIKKEA